MRVYRKLRMKLKYSCRLANSVVEHNSGLETVGFTITFIYYELGFLSGDPKLRKTLSENCIIFWKFQLHNLLLHRLVNK